MKSINLMKNVGRFDPPPQNCQVRFALESSVRFTPPEIAKSDLPSDLLYDLPPQNHQVRFTLKLSVRFTPPKIAKSDLLSNRLYDLSPRISPSPISFKCEVFEHIVLNIKNLYIIILSIFRVHFELKRVRYLKIL